MRLCDFDVGLDQPLFLIAGPCVIESAGFALEVAMSLREIAARQSVNLVYKASYDKANRTSGEAFRGPGIEQGLEILAEVRRQSGLPVLTDVHAVADVERVAAVVDVVQIPAFLCRQTDLLQAAAASGRPIHIKKGQFLSPGEMRHVVAKANAAGASGRVMVCERGASFGYNNLVVDMRGLAIMRETGCPVVFDATHSVQLPGGQGAASGGQRQFVPVLARAAVAAGVAGLFMETHPDPDRALCDGPNTWPLALVEPLIEQLKIIDAAAKGSPWLEQRVEHS